MVSLITLILTVASGFVSAQIPLQSPAPSPGLIPPHARRQNNSSLPFPSSQGGSNFRAFVQNCRQFLAGNTTALVAPVTYFSKMPDEWLNSSNATVVACSKKFETNFATLAGDNIRAFYVEMCPLLNLKPIDPAVLQRLAEARARMQQIKATCEKVKVNTLTGLPAPNSVFDKAPDYTKMLTALQTKAARIAARLANATAAQNGTTPQNGTVKPKHHGKPHGGNRLISTLANMTGTAMLDWRNSTPEAHVAFVKSMYDRLLSQPWSDAQTTQFWQVMCTPLGRRNRNGPGSVATTTAAATPTATGTGSALISSALSVGLSGISPVSVITTTLFVLITFMM